VRLSTNVEIRSLNANFALFTPAPITDWQTTVVALVLIGKSYKML
jgi:hypothetical protein